MPAKIKPVLARLLRRRIRNAVFLAALVLLLIGLLRDETRFVWQRAVQICLGCIGIG